MSQRRSPSRRKNDPERVKARILDAAAELFQNNGYAEATTEAIRKAANVSSGALHYHFPTKKDLGIAVIRERVAPAVEAAWILPVMQSQSAHEGIRRAFDGIVRDLERQQVVRGCPLNNLAIELAFADQDFRAELQPIFERWKEAIAIRLREQSGGLQSPAEPDSLASLVVAAYSGAMTMAKSSQSAEPLATVLGALEQHLSPLGSSESGAANAARRAREKAPRRAGGADKS